MHILKISRELWITTQELKQELSKVNFWVDPDTRDIPDHLAAWVLRVLWSKYKWTKRTQSVDLNAISWKSQVGNNNVQVNVKKYDTDETDDDNDSLIEKEEDISPKRKSIRERRLEEEKIRKEIEEKENEKKEIEKKEIELKKEKEKKDKWLIEEKLEKEFKKFNKKYNPKFEWWGNEPCDNRDNSVHKDWIVAITRKIELDPDEVNKDKKKSKKKIIIEETKEQKATKKIKFKELLQDEIDLMSDEEKIQYYADLDEQKRIDNEIFKEQQMKKKKVIKAYSNQEQIKKKEWVVLLPDVITVKEFAEKIWFPVTKIVANLMKNWIMATINQSVDFDTASLISLDLWVEIKRENSSASAEELIEWDLMKLIKDDKENLSPRPPVVVVMWHVDHWKTSILDYYRNSNVVSKESWWITQHIWAYQIEKNWRLITFLDTPWHEAFTSMRARWAKITDIAILVVAADDWVQPQTIEAFNHAKDAWIPIVVAMNKVDKPWINPENIKSQLSQIWLIIEEWWWDVPLVPVSAKKWTWMNELLDTVLLVSDVKEQYANPNRNAIATVIESNLDKSFWPVATILVNTWTLKLKDIFIAWKTIWRVKTMIDATWKSHKNLLPSWTARISWFEDVPNVWDILQVVNNEKEAKDKMDKIKNIYDQIRKKWLWIEEIQRRIASWKMNLLKIILKVDSIWSLEAVSDSIAKIKNDEVWVKIIHSWVWNITDSDVLMATASWALIIWFHVSVSSQTKRLAEKEWVDIQNFMIIYDILNAIRSILLWMLTSEEIEVEAWFVKILQIFYTKKKMMIVWWKVEKWFVKKWAKVIALRNWVEIWRSVITNLKFFKDDVDDVQEWNECWMQFTSKLELLTWDVLKIIVMEKKIKTIE